MTTRILPAFASMTALALLAACGSQSSEPAAPASNPNATMGDAELAHDDGALPTPDGTVDAAQTTPPAGDAAAAPADAAATPAAAPAGAVIVAGFTGNAADGKKVFNQCMACHSIKDGENRVGPSLYGIIGEKAAEVPNFKFSKAMSGSGITWTEDNLFKYLEKPSAMVPGTTMAFAGIPDGQKRADVVAFIAAKGQVN